MDREALLESGGAALVGTRRLRVRRGYQCAETGTFSKTFAMGAWVGRVFPLGRWSGGEEAHLGDFVIGLK
jgi:hypothetical protein